jgi:hypothetical protein
MIWIKELMMASSLLITPKYSVESLFLPLISSFHNFIEKRKTAAAFLKKVGLPETFVNQS